MDGEGRDNRWSVVKERTRSEEKEEGWFCFDKIAPVLMLEMSLLSMVLYLCLIICVSLSFLLYLI
jgi:hypothetical protein